MNADIAIEDPSTKLNNAYDVLNQATTRAHTMRTSSGALRSSLGSSRTHLYRGSKSKLKELPNYRHFDLKSEDFLARKITPHQNFNYSAKNRIQKQLEDLQRKRRLNQISARTYRYRQTETPSTKIDLVGVRTAHNA
jgi:hypothetical protein